MERKFSELKVPELKALAKERGLKRYSKLRKAELIALLTAQATPPAPVTRTRPPSPPPTLSPPKPDRLLEERQPTARQIKRRRNKANKLHLFSMD